MNRMTIKNVNLLLLIDEFSKNFARCAIVFVMNLFSDYNQMNLNRLSRDLTTFMTFIELLRMIILSQKITNSVAQFVRIIMKILKNHISDVARSFLNDINVKDSKTKYDDEKVASSICRYILEHIKSLNVVLTDLKRASVIIFEVKSNFCMFEIKIVEFVCDADERHFDITKIIKIID